MLVGATVLMALMVVYMIIVSGVNKFVIVRTMISETTYFDQCTTLMPNLDYVLYAYEALILLLAAKVEILFFSLFLFSFYVLLLLFLYFFLNFLIRL